MAKQLKQKLDSKRSDPLGIYFPFNFQAIFDRAEKQRIDLFEKDDFPSTYRLLLWRIAMGAKISLIQYVRIRKSRIKDRVDIRKVELELDHRLMIYAGSLELLKERINAANDKIRKRKYGKIGKTLNEVLQTAKSLDPVSSKALEVLIGLDPLWLYEPWAKNRIEKAVICEDRNFLNLIGEAIVKKSKAFTTPEPKGKVKKIVEYFQKNPLLVSKYQHHLIESDKKFYKTAKHVIGQLRQSFQWYDSMNLNDLLTKLYEDKIISKDDTEYTEDALRKILTRYEKAIRSSHKANTIWALYEYFMKTFPELSMPLIPDTKK